MSKVVQLKAADGHEFDAYVAEPTGAPRGLIVVVPEIFGVNSHIKSVADGYAADGYLAVAGSYFDRAQRHFEVGYSQPDIAAGIEIMKKVSFNDVMLDVAAVLAYGKSAGKAGIVGYCWGGVVTFRLPPEWPACLLHRPTMVAHYRTSCQRRCNVLSRFISPKRITQLL